ncbi:MAG: UTP--glucose-1-phosphate uridylyltransferase, partial [Arenimonas sp.]
GTVAPCGVGRAHRIVDASRRRAKPGRLEYRFEGRRFDCGSRIGLIEATIQYALDHDDLADAAREYMTKALQETRR